MAEKDKNNKEKVLIKQLKSPEEKEVLQTVTSLKNHGSIESIAPLIELWNEHSSVEVQNKVHEVFSDLKISGAEPIIIDSLKNEDYKSIHQNLLNAIWQSGIDYSNYIPSLTEVAVNGNYMEIFECITIIENLEETPDEELVMDAIWIIKNNKKNVDEKAQPMIDEMEKLLKSIDNEL